MLKEAFRDINLHLYGSNFDSKGRGGSGPVARSPLRPGWRFPGSAVRDSVSVGVWGLSSAVCDSLSVEAQGLCAGCAGFPCRSRPLERQR